MNFAKILLLYNNTNMNAILVLCRLGHTLYLFTAQCFHVSSLWVVHHDPEPLILFPCLPGKKQKNIAIHLLYQLAVSKLLWQLAATVLDIA